MIGITGATGKLGAIVLKKLIAEGTNPSDILALGRNENRLQELAKDLGVKTAKFDYTDQNTIDAVLSQTEKLLLISSSEVGKRFTQHKNVIEGAKKAGIKQIAYTSLLKADTSPLGLAPEHKQTEELLLSSGLNYTILRNGWYTENYTDQLPVMLEHLGFVGCAKEAKISAAPREDYAQAASKVLTSSGHDHKIYELAGDNAFTLSELASEVSAATKKDIKYTDLPEADFTKILVDAGLPEGFAQVLSSTETFAQEGALFDDSKTLSKLIGRPTRTLKEILSR